MGFDNKNTRNLIGRGLTRPILYFDDLLIYNINKKRLLNFKKINKKSKFIKIYKYFFIFNINYYNIISPFLWEMGLIVNLIITC